MLHTEQVEHDVRPVILLYVLTGHEAHDVASNLYLPIGQSTQLSAFWTSV